MKPKNFPARKLQRQIRAQCGIGAEYHSALDKKFLDARAIRTKKDRGSKSIYG